MQTPLGLERGVRPTDVKPAGRRFKIRGDDELQALFVDIDGRGTLRCLGNRLEADPTAREARQRKAVEAEIQIFLHCRGIEDRHHCRFEDLLALVCEGRGLAAVVVPGDRQHAAERRCACRIRMFQRVDGAVHARPFAVPDAEHALYGGAGKQSDLLASPHRSGGEVFIEAGLEAHIGFGEVRVRLP